MPEISDKEYAELLQYRELERQRLAKQQKEKEIAARNEWIQTHFITTLGAAMVGGATGQAIYQEIGFWIGAICVPTLYWIALWRERVKSGKWR